MKSRKIAVAIFLIGLAILGIGVYGVIELNEGKNVEAQVKDPNRFIN